MRVVLLLLPCMTIKTRTFRHTQHRQTRLNLIFVTAPTNTQAAELLAAAAKARRRQRAASMPHLGLQQ